MLLAYTHVLIHSSYPPQVKVLTVYPGLLSSLFGIIIFNLGLNHGLSRLGNEGGSALPGAFMPSDTVPGSPLFSFSVGMYRAVLGLHTLHRTLYSIVLFFKPLSLYLPLQCC
jgi:hypothetical protein